MEEFAELFCEKYFWVNKVSPKTVSLISPNCVPTETLHQRLTIVMSMHYLCYTQSTDLLIISLLVSSYVNNRSSGLKSRCTVCEFKRQCRVKPSQRLFDIVTRELRGSAENRGKEGKWALLIACLIESHSFWSVHSVWTNKIPNIVSIATAQIKRIFPYQGPPFSQQTRVSSPCSVEIVRTVWKQVLASSATDEAFSLVLGLFFFYHRLACGHTFEWWPKELDSWHIQLGMWFLRSIDGLALLCVWEREQQSEMASVSNCGASEQTEGGSSCRGQTTECTGIPLVITNLKTRERKPLEEKKL